MAERLNKRQQESVRQTIQGSQLANYLSRHVLGEVEMTPSQVSAALGLLRKVAPDLKSVDGNIELSGSLNVNLVSYADTTPEQLES